MTAQMRRLGIPEAKIDRVMSGFKNLGSIGKSQTQMQAFIYELETARPNAIDALARLADEAGGKTGA
jgi:hypothetical protein